MSLSTYYLEHGRHLGQLRRRRRHRRRRSYAPTSNTTSPDNQEKINPWVSFFPIRVSGSAVAPSAPLQMRVFCTVSSSIIANNFNMERKHLGISDEPFLKKLAKFMLCLKTTINLHSAICDFNYFYLRSMLLQDNYYARKLRN